MDLEPITTTIPGACKATGFKKSAMYNKINSGEVESVKIGGKRLVIVASLRALIERHRTAALEERGAGAHG